MATSCHTPQVDPVNGWSESLHGPLGDYNGTSCSLDLHESVETAFQVPIHTSCQRCHHLHTSVPFELPHDRLKHVRFNCDKCDHPIFGVGRSSTQTTLASVESIPKRTSGDYTRSRLSIIQSCFNRPQQLPSLWIDPLAVPDQVEEHLGTIIEANSPARRSRSTSNTQTPEALRLRHSGVPVTPMLESIPNNDPNLHVLDQVRQSSHGPENDLSLKPRRSGLRAWFKKPLFGRSGKFIIPFRKRRIQVTDTDPHHDRPSKPTIAGTTSPKHAHAGDCDPNSPDMERSTKRLPRNDRAISPAPTAISIAAGNPVPAPDPQKPSNGDDSGLLNRPVDEAQSAMRLKRERISTKRREETKKREAAEKPKCVCDNDCHCMKDNRKSSTANSDGRKSFHESEISDHHLGRIPGAFTGLGSHLYTDRRASSSAENSNSAAERNVRRRPLSQTTTIHGSNGSTISLQPARSSPRRSFNVSTFPPRQQARQYYSGMHDGQSEDSSNQLYNLLDEPVMQGPIQELRDEFDMASSERTDSDQSTNRFLLDHRIPITHMYHAGPEQEETPQYINSVSNSSSMDHSPNPDGEGLTPTQHLYSDLENVQSFSDAQAPDLLATAIRSLTREDASAEYQDSS